MALTMVEFQAYIIRLVALYSLMSLRSIGLYSFDNMLCRLVERIVVRDSQDR